MNNTIRIFLLLMVVVLGIGFMVDRVQMQKENKVFKKTNDDLLVDEEFNNLFDEISKSINKDNIEEFSNMNDLESEKMTSEIVEKVENKKEKGGRVKKKVVIKKDDKKIKIYGNQWNFSKIEFLNGADVITEINNNNYIKSIPDSQQGELIYYTTILSKNKKYVAVAKKTRMLNSDDLGSSLDVKVYDINGKYLWGGKNRNISILSNNGLFFFDTGNGIDGMEYVYVTRKIGKDIKISGTFYGSEEDVVHYLNGGVMFKTVQGDLVMDEVYDLIENTLGRTGNLIEGKLYKEISSVKDNDSNSSNLKIFWEDSLITDDYLGTDIVQKTVYEKDTIITWKNYYADRCDVTGDGMEHTEDIKNVWKGGSFSFRVDPTGRTSDEYDIIFTCYKNNKFLDKKNMSIKVYKSYSDFEY